LSTFRSNRDGRVTAARGLLVAFALALAAGGAYAEPDLDVDAQVRARQEVSHKSFDSDAATQCFMDLRTRLSVGAKLEHNTKIFVQLQDSRRLGGMDAFGQDQSGALNDGHNVDVHQAYLAVDELWGDGPGLQLGRFELNLGNQRVFGAVGWHNVGRVWEGASAVLDRDGFEARGFWLKRLELNDPVVNRDFDIYGLNTRLKNSGAEIFVFLEKDADRMDGAVDTGIDALSRLNLGAYYGRKFEALDIILNAVYQSGKQRVTDGATFAEEDLAAYLVTFEAGYALDDDGKTRLAAGIDLSSGDADPADDTCKAYDNLYYTGHKFRGFMDYFLGSGDAGLMDLMLRARTPIAHGWLLKVDLHSFSTAEDYAGTAGATKSLGTEVDVTVATKRIEGVALTAGASAFMPSEDWRGPDADTAFWFYTMFTAGF